MQRQTKYFLTIFFTGLISLLLIYILKYSTNSLTIKDFSLLKTGNFINLVFTLILLFGALFLKSKKEVHIGHWRTLTLLSVIYLFPLVFLLIFNSLNLEFKDDYFIGYPFKKIIPVLFYIISQLILIFTAFTFWYLYAGRTLMAYIYSGISVFLLTIFFLIVSLIYTYFVYEHRPYETGKKFGYGIVLGAAVWSNNRPSPIFAGRIDRAANLYKNNRIGKIQLTGGNAPGEVSEAYAAKIYLIEKYEIPVNDIIIEETTATTNEQLRYIKLDYFDKNEEELVIISDEFHLKRVEEMLDFYEINAEVVSSEYKLNFQKSLYYRLRDSIGLLLFWLFAI